MSVERRLERERRRVNGRKREARRKCGASGAALAPKLRFNDQGGALIDLDFFPQFAHAASALYEVELALALIAAIDDGGRDELCYDLIESDDAVLRELLSASDTVEFDFMVGNEEGGTLSTLDEPLSDLLSGARCCIARDPDATVDDVICCAALDDDVVDGHGINGGDEAPHAPGAPDAPLVATIVAQAQSEAKLGLLVRSEVRLGCWVAG